MTEFTDSRRMREVQPPVIPIVARWLRETPGAISLGQGVVAYGPPPSALAAVGSFGMNPHDHLYGPVRGEPELIEAFRQKLARDNRMRIGSGNRIIVTAGANMAFCHAVVAVADPGDEIILQTPFYFNHAMAVAMAGCRVVTVPTGEDWHLQPQAIARAITPRTRAVVTISPNNPTGAVYPETDLRAVNELSRARGLYHIHDEAYEYFLYDGARHFSPGAIPAAEEHTLSLFSLSKSFGFAGWRIGCMVVPLHLADALDKIQDTDLICPPRITQRAALAALAAGRAYCDDHITSLARVREMVFTRLATIAPTCTAVKTRGAFYAFVQVNTALSDLTLAERLVREFGVAVVPGSAFGLSTGCFLRLSYGSLAAETVVAGMDRLTRGITALAGSPPH